MLSTRDHYGPNAMTLDVITFRSNVPGVFAPLVARMC